MLALNNLSRRVKLAIILVFFFCFLLNINKVNIYSRFTQHKEVKYILFWNSFFSDKSFEFGVGNKPFLENECDVKDCFISVYEDNAVTDIYDAIVFHGPEFVPLNTSDFPAVRLAHQRYVYFSMESPQNRPVRPNLDGVFNWTMTYRLDSDIMVPYFTFSDTSGQIVSPSNNPKWIKRNSTSSAVRQILLTKKKPVAWFASNCHSNNEREILVEKLASLLSVDIYGSCGPLKCPRNNEQLCFEMLKKDYFFYLSYENSNCEDYMTEKLTNAMLNDAVPIVLGGSNFSKFLPPHSFIDATKLTTEQLADKIVNLMRFPEKYLEYFWWKDFYTLLTRQQSEYKPFCKLCEMLHDSNLGKKYYQSLTEWWNGNDKHRVCT